MEAAFEIPLPTLPVETAEFSADPDPWLESARREHPWLARFSHGYIVHGYQATVDLLSDDTRLRPGYGGIVDHYGERGTLWGRFWEENLGTPFEQAHIRQRASVADAFTPRHANQLRPLIQQVMNDLLDEWLPRGAFDFAEFASYFPVTVICSILGVSPEPIPRLRSALEAQFALFGLDLAAKPLIMESWEVLWSFADELVTLREKGDEYDDNSLLDWMIAAARSGKLSETELRFALITLLTAGYDTSKNMLTLVMKLLLEQPESYTRCAEDKDYCRKVVQEALRHSGIGIPFRDVVAEFDYGGFQFRTGDRLVFPASLPGRDPAVFPDPLAFNPERANSNRHVAFGRGRHICLGQFIASAQLQEGLHLIAQRLKNPQLAGDVRWRPFLSVWGLETLPITFTPQS
ncbi:MAG: cytochrome P450 [Novosphingobium sp.]|nr:cytochrome P450 [Novosphingobium sp.]